MQRLRLPDSPVAWAKTLSHVVRNAATPKKALLVGEQDNTNTGIANIMNMNSCGRPRRTMSHIKKKLFDSGLAPSLGIQNKIITQYTRRQKNQSKQDTKKRMLMREQKEMVQTFLEQHSRTMPNKKDTLIMEGTPVAKRHLLATKFQTYKLFKASKPDYNISFSTFYRLIPRNIKVLDQTCRRVCVCIKDYNIEQRVDAMNKAASDNQMPNLRSTVHDLSKETICQCESNGTPARACVDRECSSCGIQAINRKYEPLIEAAGNYEAKYHQWEQHNENYTDKHGKTRKTKKWKQVNKTSTLKHLANDIASMMGQHTSHIFRVNYQHNVEKHIM